MMVEIIQESSKCHRRLDLIVMAGFAFSCIAAGIMVVLVRFVLPCDDCSLPADTTFKNIYWGAAILLFLLGVMSVVLLIYYERRQNSVTSQAAISPIPAEDLEKSPAFILPFNRVLQRQPIAQHSSTDFTALDLPDYLTAVQNIDGVYSSRNSEVWTENVSETPPPCYEKALEMTTLAVTAKEANTSSSKQAFFTQEMDQSNEIFV